MHWIAEYMMRAPVNKIIPFSNVDGPGNRCAIFFQSCPFSCLYCHNPETIHMCQHCGDCITTCPVHALKMEEQKVVWDASICVNCDQCIQTCTHLASPKIKNMSVDEIVEIIQKKKAFLRGITVSGGECMNHAPFLLELFTKVKAMGLTCLIDSNGYHDFESYPELLDVCDGVMLDVKASDSVFHKMLCGCDNQTVLKNLSFLLEKGKLEEVRTVILPNQDEQNEKTVRYVSSLIHDNVRYKLIRYRKYGVRTEGLEALGNVNVSEEYIARFVNICKILGNTTNVVI
ncbi:MAG: YjjW family glycine radical enzyme activase [Longicatena sp.]